MTNRERLGAIYEQITAGHRVSAEDAGFLFQLVSNLQGHIRQTEWDEGAYGLDIDSVRTRRWGQAR